MWIIFLKIKLKKKIPWAFFGPFGPCDLWSCQQHPSEKNKIAWFKSVPCGWQCCHQVAKKQDKTRHHKHAGPANK